MVLVGFRAPSDALIPCELVNSVMISPQPPRLRMKRRNTVSVTPAMGASTVAGAMRTLPIVTDVGTGTVCVAESDSPAPGVEVSQNLRINPFYLQAKNKALAKKARARVPRKSLASLTFSPALLWRTSGGNVPPGRPYPEASACR